MATNDSPEFRPLLKATSWWKLNRERIANPKADYWVFVLMGFEMKSTDFVVIKPSELLKRLDKITRDKAAKMIHSYLWVTKDKRCLESRGLNRKKQMEIIMRDRRDFVRDFSRYLNNWSPFEIRLGIC